ncbi:MULTISPECIES: aldo/keto reductase [Brevibacillus]|jgi:diketogulonate reductase-like aldo/keto reductase|uniref:2,5-diketo-D-gluconic acid reductase n=1 Tax=Brevibacillus borstelensis AK1 TaxID=1300222 RepID=M8E9F5_9BACL|nr:aldo/keto reductase [Brevibacillus borstelensis]EMT52090.1 2,5-diketo-D-gluconic acid reductase [Brevibacillus borstelensis AK1]MCM3471411.1 aldo/keto reductase [Brevibacillus borstelensis]MCM3624272.1 aldo/keto reductase [Brevibacillus borstelensis]MED1853225.1 aldo/keto reductase [Brevibacillus borstelensis]WNF07153.1 aldo/keto reductase [Brevibacillus borstelensis]
MATHLADTTVLNNGIKMPWLGLGVWKVKEGDEVQRAILSAIETGYRAIDTAAVYGNEAGVGDAIRDSGIARDQLFITTKVWNSDQGYETTLKAFDESMKKLRLDYLDLYLVHWPVQGKYLDTWKALEKLYRDGYVRAIGVSNFHVHHLEDLKQNSEIVPAVDQVEYHPLLTQKELLAYCKENGIQMEAWSPLMQGNLDQPVLVEIGQKYGKSPAQVILRWDLQNGVVTIPKSVTPERIRQNADVFDFTLTAEEMEQISRLNQNKRFGPDPDNFDF